MDFRPYVCKTKTDVTMHYIVLATATITPIISLLFATILVQGTKHLRGLVKLTKYLLIMVAISALTGLVLTQTNMHALNLGAWHIIFRLEPLSLGLLFMVSTIGYIIVRFSATYLQGDRRQIAFMRRLNLAIVFVQMFVLSGNLIGIFVSWVATSIALHYLLCFYSDRKAALFAARKKFIIARFGDACLFIAMVLLYLEFKTIDLESIVQQLSALSSNQAPIMLEWAAVCLVIAAVFKSAQLPFHGWILDVMETPTPVSGLLHAGLLNAGPFLIIRFAYVMDVVTVAPLILLVLGGLTALFGTIVFPSQPAIKTSLAYSSIGHMGFSLMICGMGLYAASLLHLMAHSFYKAHAFLSSGSAIDKHRLAHLNKSDTKPIGFWNVLIGFAIPLVCYVAINTLWGGMATSNIQLFVLGAIILTAVTSYSVRVMAYGRAPILIFKTAATAGFVLFFFFFFETMMNNILGNQVPHETQMHGLAVSMSILMLFMFITALFLPKLEAIMESRNIGDKWRIYKRNGFYLHTRFDRLLNALHPKGIQ